MKSIHKAQVSKQNKLDIKNLIFNDRFQVKKKISSGSFGVVYACLDLQTKEFIALKIERTETSKFRSLQKEIIILEHLQDLSIIPKLYWHGQEHNCTCMAQQLLGRDLSHYIKHFNKFSLKCVVNIADQMLNTLEQIHNRGVLHRDIKPENILTGRDQLQNQLYLVDFGISKFYLDSKNKHIPFVENKAFIGTTRYASLASHKGYEQSRKDDLESLGYVLLYLSKGNLVWQNIITTNDKDKPKLVGKLKKDMSISELCSTLPSEFPKYFEYIRKLKFEQQPDYNYLRQLFQNIAKKYKFYGDKRFDWTENGTSTSTKSSDNLKRVDDDLIQFPSSKLKKNVVLNNDSQHTIGMQSSIYNNYTPTVRTGKSKQFIQGLKKSAKFKKQDDEDEDNDYSEEKQIKMNISMNQRGDKKFIKQQTNFSDLDQLKQSFYQKKNKSQQLKESKREDSFNDFEVEDEDNELGLKFEKLKDQSIMRQDSQMIIFDRNLKGNLCK